MHWVPWVLHGTWFKLLAINPLTGGFSMMLKVAPLVYVPIHTNIGAIEALVLEGELFFGDESGENGIYLFEHGGIKRQPHTREAGAIVFAVVHGPLLSYEEDGSIATVIDAKVMYELAEASGEIHHLARPVEWDY